MLAMTLSQETCLKQLLKLPSCTGQSRCEMDDGKSTLNKGVGFFIRCLKAVQMDRTDSRKRKVVII